MESGDDDNFRPPDEAGPSFRSAEALGRTVEKDAVLEGNANTRKATKRRGVRRGRQLPYTRTSMTNGWLCEKPTTSKKTRISLNFFCSAREIQIW